MKIEVGGSGLPARLRRWAEPVAWFVGFLLVWQIGVTAGHVSDLTLPTPLQFLSRLYTNFGTLYGQAKSTLAWVIVGFFAGAVPAVPLGFLIVTVPILQRTLYPFLISLNVVPKIALVPLLLVWFGFGGLPKVIVAALLVFFPVMVDTIAGFRALDPRLFHLTRSMGCSGAQTLWYLRLPAALPFIFSGMKISVVLAVTVVVVSEFVGSNEGLGYLILRATANHDLSLSFAALFVAAVIGLVLSLAIETAERATIPWEARRTENHK